MISQQENVNISSAGVGPGHCGEERREGREIGQGGEGKSWGMPAGEKQTSAQHNSSHVAGEMGRRKFREGNNSIS